MIAMSTIDRISPLLDKFRVRTRVLHTGPLCGVTTFAAEPGRGFLHVLRDGEMTVSHPGPGGRLEQRHVDRPSIVFYPRSLEHAFHNAPTEESDFACATLDFEGGADHPLVRTLPPVIILPLDSVDTLRPSLELLFAEIDHVRCGQRVLADRLFEIVLIHLMRWLLDHPEEANLPPGLFTAMTDERLARALLALHESPGRRWTLTTMAHEANLSRSAFAALFKRRLGQSPADYLADWRIVLAQDGLRSGSSVTQLSHALGYANPAALSRAFTQRVGSSPRAWLADRFGS